MNKIIENRLNEINILCKNHMVKSLFLFGSASSEEFNENSDIDLLISFKDNLPLLDFADNFFDLEESLNKLLKRQIDLVVEKSIKNPYFKEAVEKSKIKIYEA